MGPTEKERSSTLGGEIDLLFLKSIKAKASYEEFKRELLKLEKRWLQRARTPAQRLSVRRTIAKTLLTEAFGFNMPWKEFGPILRRLQRLGFRDLGMRVHVACLYVQSLESYPQRARDAWDMLEDAERRLLCIRKGHFRREEGLEAITHARKVARVGPGERRARQE
jgi:hypothetical protein